MKLLIVFTIAFMSLVIDVAYGHDDWRCTEQGITREGSVFVSCGMGEGTNESIARENALYSATTDFKSLCSMDSNCKNHKVSVEPGRMTCERESNDTIYGAGSFKCYRIIRFTIGGRA
jgi:hypothetical protein